MAGTTLGRKVPRRNIHRSCRARAGPALFAEATGEYLLSWRSNSDLSPVMDTFILTPYFLDDPLPQLAAFARPGWKINAPDLRGDDQQARMSALHKVLANEIAAILRSGGRPVSVAGDCCAAIAVSAGLQRAELDASLIWFDAHGDFNTWETSPSGFLGGMPLAMLVGRGEQRMPEAVGLNSIPEDRIWLSDGRDLDPAEKEAIAGSRLTHFADVTNLLERDLPGGPIHVHFDTDILDPTEAPAMSYPAPGGPSAAVLGEVFDKLARSGQVMAVSVSTWNPELDSNGSTAELCLGVLDQLLGSDK